MKICVYAICKNEEANVDAWVDSMSEADEIYVLDTGSNDNTVAKLLSKGVNVKSEIINPWRFDVARNKSLELVPPDTDLYVCTDLDERFAKGWRKVLESNYSKEYTRVKYTYNWSFDENGRPATVFYLNKIHNKNYTWTHPVHEVLTALKDEKEIVIDKIILNHYQDYQKSRSNYLPLLELSVKEDPEDDRNVHYLGREYMYYKMHDKCIETLHRHLKLKKATWKDERAASMRYIARSYLELGYEEEAYLWYALAIKEAPYLREAYVEMAYLLYGINKYDEAIENLDKALEIKNKSKSYINENYAWDYHVYDLYAICAYYLNKKDIAKQYNEIAISMNPNDERLINNQLFFDQNAMND
ncbi:MAG: glycosyl transferase family 2 [Firmicutes bacterium]|nr:glycosyl transferase family 2 [Bacillota bacterium]